MASLTLTFSAPLNTSCQIGDTAYYVDTESSGGFLKNDGDVVEIGEIRQVTNPLSNSPSIICETLVPGELNSLSKFILFSKDNKANTSSILGYYASVKFVNSSTAPSELFSVTIDTFDSSK